jgi:hypothetical protein
MENYRIYFEKGEEEEILTILRNTKGVLIDAVNDRSIGISIEGTNPKNQYLKLLNIIDRYVFSFRPFHRYP